MSDPVISLYIAVSDRAPLFEHTAAVWLLERDATLLHYSDPRFYRCLGCEIANGRPGIHENPVHRAGFIAYHLGETELIESMDESDWREALAFSDAVRTAYGDDLYKRDHLPALRVVCALEALANIHPKDHVRIAYMTCR